MKASAPLTAALIGAGLLATLPLAAGAQESMVVETVTAITDARGDPVFELPRSGPMLYVMLPNGKYYVSARIKGLTESQEGTVAGKDGKDPYFHWKEEPKA